MEPTIRVKLIPDTSGLTGGLGSVPGGLKPNDADKNKDASLITIPITDVLGGILKGINKMAEASPMLQASLDLLGKGIMFALRPIGDIFAQLIRPMAMLLIRFFGPIAAKSMDIGFFPSVGEAIKEKPAEAIKVGLVLGGLSLIPALLSYGMANLFKWLIGGMALKGATVEATAGGSALGLPIMLILAGGALGYLAAGLGGLIAGALGSVAGLVIASAAGVTGGVAAVITIGVSLVAIGGFMIVKDLLKQIYDETGDGGYLEKLFGNWRKTYEGWIKAKEAVEQTDFKKGDTSLPIISNAYDKMIKSKYGDVDEGAHTKIDVLNEGIGDTNELVNTQNMELQNTEENLFNYTNATEIAAGGNLVLDETTKATTNSIVQLGKESKNASLQVQGLIDKFNSMPTRLRLYGTMSATLSPLSRSGIPQGGTLSFQQGAYTSIGEALSQWMKDRGFPTNTGGT